MPSFLTKKMNKVFPLIFFLLVMLVGGCKKDSFITSPDALIGLSSDTLFFDTVFVTTGSVTQQVKIINQNAQKIKISAIRLMGGASSVFKINIDGSAVSETDNLEIGANDSVYLFVSVFINPAAPNLPFILRDSIEVSFNGNHQYIQLQAWGQNAHFLKNRTLTGQVTFTNDLPYVITGGLQVAPGATLTINSGCRIYLHADAPLLVDGSLQAQGDSNARILFTGDRLDMPYNSYPGSWPGIVFRGSSTGNQLTYCVIKNAYQAIVTPPAMQPGDWQLALNQCIVDNSYDAGIYAVQSNISATNCLLSNCGKNLALTGGGHYQFTYCTVASYSNDYISHNAPVLQVSNYLQQGAGYLVSGLNASFLNCIFWGGNGLVDDEVTVSLQPGLPAPSVQFSGCLWKVKNSPQGADTSGMLVNTDPMFDSVNNLRRYYDFHLRSQSPAIGSGMVTAGIATDLDGLPRVTGGRTDRGCYENIP